MQTNGSLPIDIDLDRLIELEYLGLSESDTEGMSNPFERRTGDDLIEPHMHVLRLMSTPEYFYFTVKTLCGIELSPYQCVILAELWNRRFPMLVGSRGMGKSFLLAIYAILYALFKQGSKVVICGSGFRQAKTVFNYAETIWDRSPMLRSLVAESRQSGPRHGADRWVLQLGDSTITALPIGDGTKIRGERANCIMADEFACVDPSTLVETDRGLMRIADSFHAGPIELFTGVGSHTEAPERYIKTPLTDAYRVRTVGNYEFVCSSIHQVFTADGWKIGKDLAPGDLLSWENHYAFPEDYVEKDGYIVDEDLAWAIGLMVAEGSVNDRCQIQVKMTDRGCVERFSRILSAYPGIDVGIHEVAPVEDERGWVTKVAWCAYVHNPAFREALVSLGLERTTAHGKKIPWSILQSPRSVVLAFLSGLFEGDGSAFHWADRETPNKLGVAYYSVSEALCREVQVVLQKLDIFCTRQDRESNLSEHRQWMLRLNGKQALRLARLLEVGKWDGVAESSYEASLPDSRRGVVWDESRQKWKAEATLPDGGRKYLGRFAGRDDAIEAVDAFEAGLGRYIEVKSVEKLDGQRHLYDYHLPSSHSFMGNGFRQHNSIPREIFETVISGFGVVNLSPIQQAKKRARQRVMRRLGGDPTGAIPSALGVDGGNQIVLSGTAYYQFNHFCDYWKKWSGLVHSKGDPDRIREVCGGEPEPGMDWRDYSVIRFPYTMLPEGYYDEAQISRSKGTIHSGIFANEFGAVFSSDSNGFLKRSLIETCVTNTPVTPNVADAAPVQFKPATRGNPAHRYILGVDPASEQDNFAVVVLEIHGDHRRVVHCWTTSRQRYNARVKGGSAEEGTYYGYCARKIRELMRSFPGVELIALDAQGGGQNGVLESLHDPANMLEGERPIWAITADHPLSDGKERDSDDRAGLHMVELCQFADSKYVSGANHGLKKDFEDRVTLFPMYDAVMLAEAMVEDHAASRTSDTLDDCVGEIEELKDELTTIVHSQTPGTLRDKWDTPEVKIAGSKKGRLRKDRYSALLIANHAARRLHRRFETPSPEPYGGFANLIRDRESDGDKMYLSAPDWFTSQAAESWEEYGWAGGRGGSGVSHR